LVKYLMALQRAIGRLIAYVFRRKARVEARRQELKDSVSRVVERVAAKAKKTIDDV
jgi:hypothetical protein